MSVGQVKVTVPGVYSGVVPVADGESIADVLKKCQVDGYSAKQIMLDGAVSDADALVRSGQTIYVMPQVAGNR